MSAHTISFLVFFLSMAAVARAQLPGSTLKPEARAHYERGLKLYERSQYDDAIAELRTGLAIDPQPELLYALGQAERKSGHCERALEHFQACVALLKNPAAEAAVRVQIERCRVEQKDSPPLEAVEAVEKTKPEPRAPEEPALLPGTVKEAPLPSFIRDPLGGALSALGVAGVITGGALVGFARDKTSHAQDSYRQFADAKNATAVWTGGVVSLSVGGALLLAGMVRYAVVAARRRGRSAPATKEH